MNSFSLMEKSWGKCIFGIFLFAILLLARDTLVTSCLIGFTKSQILMVSCLCLLGIVFLAVNYRSWKQILRDQRILLIVLSAGVLLLPMVLKQDWQLMYFSILVCLVTAVFLTYFTGIRETAKYYVVILSVLCLHSLVSLWLWKGLAISGAWNVPLMYNANGEEFFNFGLSFVVTSPHWYRNFGIFREPGVYQFFIILAMYLNNYKVSWKSPLWMWVVNGLLMVTMVSTFAVGGIIEMGLFVFFLYFDKKWYQTKTGRSFGIMALLMASGLVTYVIVQVRKGGLGGTVWFEFMDLYLRLFTKSDSLMDRLDAIFVSAGLFLRNPLVGDTIANVLHGTAHNTSSTLILYAVLGIVGGSLNVAAWVALAWEKRRGLIGNMVLLTILFMSFNTQNLVADVFFWLFPYMALVEYILPKLSGKKVLQWNRNC